VLLPVKEGILLSWKRFRVRDNYTNLKLIIKDEAGNSVKFLLFT
jgi:hypothetical protein